MQESEPVYPILGEHYVLTEKGNIAYKQDRSSVVLDADRGSFEDLEGGYAQDAAHVFYHGKMVSAPGKFGSEPIASKTFESLGHGYARDENDVFYLGKTLYSHADPESFTILETDDFIFGRDKDYFFLEGRKIANVDPETFGPLDLYYFADKDSVFTKDSFKNIGPREDFEILNWEFAKNAETAFYQGEKIYDSDPETFEVLDYGFSRDTEHVYFGTHKTILDPKEYKYLGHIYARDQKNIVYGYENLPKSGPDTFLMRGHSDTDTLAEWITLDFWTFRAGDTTYFWDKDNAYYYNLSGFSNVHAWSWSTGAWANLSIDFHALEYLGDDVFRGVKSVHTYGPEVFRDKNKIYLWTTHCTSVQDPETFEVLSYNFAKDSQHLYFYDYSSCFEPIEIPEDLDLASFEIFVLYRSYGGNTEKTYLVVEDTIKECLEHIRNPSKLLFWSPYYMEDGEYLYAKNHEGCPVLMEDVDRETFEPVKGEDTHDAQDKNQKYLRGEVVE